MLIFYCLLMNASIYLYTLFIKEMIPYNMNFNQSDFTRSILNSFKMKNPEKEAQNTDTSQKFKQLWESKEEQSKRYTNIIELNNALQQELSKYKYNYYQLFRQNQSEKKKIDQLSYQIKSKQRNLTELQTDKKQNSLKLQQIKFQDSKIIENLNRQITNYKKVQLSYNTIFQLCGKFKTSIYPNQMKLTSDNLCNFIHKCLLTAQESASKNKQFVTLTQIISKQGIFKIKQTLLMQTFQHIIKSQANLVQKYPQLWLLREYVKATHAQNEMMKNYKENLSEVKKQISSIQQKIALGKQKNIFINVSSLKSCCEISDLGNQMQKIMNDLIVKSKNAEQQIEQRKQVERRFKQQTEKYQKQLQQLASKNQQLRSLNQSKSMNQNLLKEKNAQINTILQSNQQLKLQIDQLSQTTQQNKNYYQCQIQKMKQSNKWKIQNMKKQNQSIRSEFHCEKKTTVDKSQYQNLKKQLMIVKKQYESKIKCFEQEISKLLSEILQQKMTIKMNDTKQDYINVVKKIDRIRKGRILSQSPIFDYFKEEHKLFMEKQIQSLLQLKIERSKTLLLVDNNHNQIDWGKIQKTNFLLFLIQMKNGNYVCGFVDKMNKNGILMSITDKTIFYLNHNSFEIINFHSGHFEIGNIDLMIMPKGEIRSYLGCKGSFVKNCKKNNASSLLGSSSYQEIYLYNSAEFHELVFTL